MKLLEKLKFPTSSRVSKTKKPPEYSDLFDIHLNDLNGNPIKLRNFKGKFLLFVNVASECGFTSQYRELQQLSDSYKDRLVVIGLPCNQFGNQEPGTTEQIKNFCSRSFGVTFLLTEKVLVKGKQKHPLYAWLTEKRLNNTKSSSVKWNFQKYLVSPDGILIDYYYSITKPTSSKITKHLN